MTSTPTRSLCEFQRKPNNPPGKNAPINRGVFLTVDEVTALRVEMRKAGVEYIVLKNTMVERACRELNIDESVHAMLKGPSAFAFGCDDAVAPAKILKDSIKKFKNAIKGGIVDGVVTDAQGIDALANLPPRGSHRAYAGQHDEPHHHGSLAIALDQLAKKLGGGEAAEEAAAE